MRILALAAAAFATAGALTPEPAAAQRHGWNGDREWRGGGGRHWRGDRGDRRDNRRWNRQWNRAHHRGWRGGYRARSRVVCDVVPGYWGPQRHCYRVWR